MPGENPSAAEMARGAQDFPKPDDSVTKHQTDSCCLPRLETEVSWVQDDEVLGLPPGPWRDVNGLHEDRLARTASHGPCLLCIQCRSSPRCLERRCLFFAPCTTSQTGPATSSTVDCSTGVRSPLSALPRRAESRPLYDCPWDPCHRGSASAAVSDR